MLTPSALAWALYRCGARFDKIGLKLTLVEHWLATFIVTSKFGLVVDQNQHNISQHADDIMSSSEEFIC